MIRFIAYCDPSKANLCRKIKIFT